MSGNAQDALDPKMVLSPLLSVRNGIRAVEFYKQAFGAKELSRIDDGQGSIVARLSIGTSEFWLADEAPNYGNFSPESLGGSTVRMILTVDDPDALFASAVQAGATVVDAVSDKDYGWRVWPNRRSFRTSLGDRKAVAPYLLRESRVYFACDSPNHRIAFRKS